MKCDSLKIELYHFQDRLDARLTEPVNELDRPQLFFSLLPQQSCKELKTKIQTLEKELSLIKSTSGQHEKQLTATQQQVCLHPAPNSSEHKMALNQLRPINLLGL